jgi:predicted ATPase
VLLIVTFRPEFQPAWTGQPQVSLLALNRLDRRDCTALVEQIAGGKANFRSLSQPSTVVLSQKKNGRTRRV